MGILRKVMLTGLLGVGSGVTGVGLGMAYLTNSTSLIPLTKDDPIFKTKTWARYNPGDNPSLKDDAIKVVPLSKIRPELRNDETALTLEFCRGVWGRWGFWTQSRLHDRYDHPPGTDDNLWQSSELAVAKYEKGLRFSNHFEVVENVGTEITFRCGASPLEQGLRESDALVLLSAKIDTEQQHAVFHFKSAMFNSAAPKTTPLSFPAPISYLHTVYARILTHSAMRNVML